VQYKLPELYILPWYGNSIEVNFAEPESLVLTADVASTLVEGVEKEDPWVKDTFGVSGVGEGLVFYPVNPTIAHPEILFTYMWKAKGEKHRTVGAHQAVQVNASVAASVDEFVNLTVTEARLLQGFNQLCGDMGKIQSLRVNS
jgi:hypothetical protein